MRNTLLFLFTLLLSVQALAADWTGEVMGVTNPAEVDGVLAANIGEVSGVATGSSGASGGPSVTAIRIHVDGTTWIVTNNLGISVYGTTDDLVDGLTAASEASAVIVDEFTDLSAGEYGTNSDYNDGDGEWNDEPWDEGASFIDYVGAHVHWNDASGTDLDIYAKFASEIELGSVRIYFGSLDTYGYPAVTFYDQNNELIEPSGSPTGIDDYEFNDGTYQRAYQWEFELGTVTRTAAAIMGVTASAEGTYSGGGGGGDGVISSMAAKGNAYTAANNYAYITELDGTTFAMMDANGDELVTLSFDGTDFSEVGNQLSLTKGNNVDVVKLTTTRVAVLDDDNEEIQAYSWNGTSWSSLGNAFSYTMANYPTGSYLADNSIVVWNGSEIQRFDFDGTDFSKVGTAFSDTGNYSMPIGLTSTRMAVHSTASDDIITLDYASGSWSQTGNTYSHDSLAGKLAGTRYDDNTILVWATGDLVEAYTFDGTDWAQEGTGVDVGASSWPRSMAKMSSTLLAKHWYGGGGNIEAVEFTLE